MKTSPTPPIGRPFSRIMANYKMIRLFFVAICNLAALHVSAKTIDITELGAKGDGKTDNTAIIQQAIDHCGSGTVVIPEGNFVTGPIFIRSGISIYLKNGATLSGITKLDIYRTVFSKLGPKHVPALIYGENIEHVTIYGEGTIDGQGGDAAFQLGDDSKTGAIRPIMLYFRNSRDITIRDIHIRNSAYWVQKYELCDGVSLRGLTVHSHCNFNNDGIDINGSSHVVIADCNIDTDDDALCFKSDTEEMSENIVVTNCLLRSNCNGIKFGTGSNGGFRNITVSNCALHKASEENRRHWKQHFPWMKLTGDTTILSGIALEVVDGGLMDQVIVSNVTMRDVQTPIFIRLGDRRRGAGNRVSAIRNISIHDVIASSASALSSSITGLPGHCVENVHISNVQIISPGGVVQDQQPRAVPENPAAYPENRMFGVLLPASGFYLRHVKNITFDNVRLQTLTPDSRPAFLLDDVSGFEDYRCSLNGEKAGVERVPNS